MPFIKKLLSRILFDLQYHFRWSFLPPLIIYFSAGLSGLTAITGAFYVKEQLGLSAAFLAGLGFWASLPWALKMVFGHLVDIIWTRKTILIYLGAILMAASFTIMFAVIQFPDCFRNYLPLESWYVISVILTALGLVLQDSVADAMSVEAVPKFDRKGQTYEDTHIKAFHTTMQTFGRFALIGGIVIVALINIYVFKDVALLEQEEKTTLYGRMYLLALIIPLISISSVTIATFLRLRAYRHFIEAGLKPQEINTMINPQEKTNLNYKYIWGGMAIFGLIFIIGILDFTYSQEIVFVGSISVILYLMFQMVGELDSIHRTTLFGTALIIFVFRAVPLPGPGLTWFEIDELGFDQQFLSILTLLTSLLTLIGMVLLRPLIVHKSISYIIVLLTLFAGILSLPNIALYYGLHHWTAPLTGGVVDARFIALIDAAIESPLGQVAMIPMLAWIARNAPDHLKATFFAVMASFTNLALSASNLLTKYINEIFVITREVKDRASGEIVAAADYSQLGVLLITVACISVLAPLLIIILVKRSPLHVAD